MRHVCLRYVGVDISRPRPSVHMAVYRAEENRVSARLFGCDSVGGGMKTCLHCGREFVEYSGGISIWADWYYDCDACNVRQWYTFGVLFAAIRQQKEVGWLEGDCREIPEGCLAVVSWEAV